MVFGSTRSLKNVEGKCQECSKQECPDVNNSRGQMGFLLGSHQPRPAQDSCAAAPGCALLQLGVSQAALGRDM